MDSPRHGTHRMRGHLNDRATTPTLFVMGSPEHGGADRHHSVEWLYEALEEQSVESRFVLYPDEGHVFEREANQRNVLSRVIPRADAHLQ